MKFHKNDVVSYQGKEYEIELDFRQRLCIKIGFKLECIDTIEDKFTLVRKHYNKMEYAGAVASVISIAENRQGMIIYLELIGQEDMVKSITSLIMMGRIKMNDHYLNYTGGYFQVFRGGTKRLMQQCGDGLVHAILYHGPSVKDTNFNTLLGQDEEDMLDNFVNWLDKTNPLPYPKALVSDIYQGMKDRELLTELNCTGIKAFEIDDQVGQNEFEQLQEIIVDCAVDAGVMNTYQKKIVEDEPTFAYPLPKSRLLTGKQVEAIYAKLSSMPKTYETEEWKLKPVLKLFNASMTLYVTEQDKAAGTIVHGEPEGQVQCFGYVYNESYGEGEWGYIDFDEYIRLGFEMDLYFENKYIDPSATIQDRRAVIYSRSDIEIAASGEGVGFDEFVQKHGFSKRGVA